MFIKCETTKTDSSRLTEMLSALNRTSNPVFSSATGVFSQKCTKELGWTSTSLIRGKCLVNELYRVTSYGIVECNFSLEIFTKYVQITPK